MGLFVLCDVAKNGEIALGIARHILVSFLYHLFDDFYLWLSIHIFLSTLFIILFLLNHHLLFDYLLYCRYHLTHLLRFFPGFEFRAVQGEFAELTKEGGDKISCV